MLGAGCFLPPWWDPCLGGGQREKAGLLQGLLEEGFQDYVAGRAGAGGRFVCVASVVLWPCLSRGPGHPVYLTIWEMGAREALPWLSERPCELI